VLLVGLNAFEGTSRRYLTVSQRQLAERGSRIIGPTPLRQRFIPVEYLANLEFVVIIALVLVVPRSAIATAITAAILRRATFLDAEQGEVQVAT